MSSSFAMSIGSCTKLIEMIAQLFSGHSLSTLPKQPRSLRTGRQGTARGHKNSLSNDIRDLYFSISVARIEFDVMNLSFFLTHTLNIVCYPKYKCCNLNRSILKNSILKYPIHHATLSEL